MVLYKSFKIVCLSLSIAMAPTMCYSQAGDAGVLSQVIPADPEAENITRYGNYNLNLAAGQIDISAPIYTLKGITKSFPVSISYDHKGLLVAERASSIGMNWNLNAIGLITRTVVGLPDETNGIGYNYQYANVNASSNPQTVNDPVYAAADGRIDLEPDIYHYSFNGHSGSFL